GERQGYYGDYAELPAEHLGRALATGFAYQGEPSPYRQGKWRGEPSGHLPATAFVAFLQNHDQIGNRPFGDRIAALAPEPLVHAAAAIVLLSPQLPLLFMGEEWGSLRPFLFFCDFAPPLGEAVRQGRRRCVSSGRSATAPIWCCWPISETPQCCSASRLPATSSTVRERRRAERWRRLALRFCSAARDEPAR